MKKKILIIFLLFVFLSGIAGYLYFESILTSLAVSTLKSGYGLVLTYDDLNSTSSPGWITIRNLRIFDSLREPLQLLAEARRLKLDIDKRKALQGHFVLNHLQGNGLNLDVYHLADGELNWEGILKRFVPKNTPARVAQAVSTPFPAIPTPVANSNVPTPADTTHPQKEAANISAAPKPAAIPVILSSTPVYPAIKINDLQLNYHADLIPISDRYGIHIDELLFKPNDDQLTFQHTQVTVSDNGQPLLKADTLTIQNLIRQKTNDLEIAASTIHLHGREIGVDRYDFSEVLTIWMHVYHEIGAVISPLSPPPEIEKQEIGALLLDKVTIDILPATGSIDAPGAIRLLVDTLSFSRQNDELTLTGVHMQEAGQAGLRLRRLVLNGVREGLPVVKQLELQGMQIEIHEDQTGSLNVNRAIQRIRSVIQSLIPKTGKTASLPVIEPDEQPEVILRDGRIVYYSHGRPEQSITVQEFETDGESHSAQAANIKFSSLAEEKDLLLIPSIHVETSEQGWQALRRVTVSHLRADFDMLFNKHELIHAASEWIAVVKAVHDMHVSPAKTVTRPFRIDELILLDSTIHMTDKRLIQPVRHVIDPMNVSCRNLQIGGEQPPMAAVSGNTKLVAPGRGLCSFEGLVSPVLNPANLIGAATLFVEDLMAYAPYFQDSMPVGIDKSGFRLFARLFVRDNHMDCTFDMVLDNPVFSLEKGKWPVQIDSRTAVAALNGMKNKSGRITFRENRLEGDFYDPRFNFGVGITEILGKNLLNRTFAVLKLPFNVAGSGANVFKKGVDSIGNMMKRITPD